MNKNNPDVAVVVSSCDAFSDCWAPFVYSLEKYASNCPYPIYIVSNLKTEAISDKVLDIHFLQIGEDEKWGTNLHKALSLINADYVLYLQEDYFLSDFVSWNDIKNHINYCIQNSVDYLRLTFPFLPGKEIDNNYVKNDLSQAYSVCLQAALWKKKTLEQLCVKGWSGWDFEKNVVALIRKLLPQFSYLGLKNSALGQIRYVKGTAVRKGKWTHPGYSFLRKNGFAHLLKNRAKEPLWWQLVDVDGPLRIFAKCLWRLLNKILS